mmetsp:Transcript_4672/g.14119  ORF Transcript_4672/g.14119 Transcript_4672/m.14119 type:complete len:272 (+) Transcript_4672:1304-2119(+)
MTNVLTSLSSVSSSAIAWMIMLSTLFTLNFTFAREYECARPSCARRRSPSLRPSMKRAKLTRMPRTTSPTISLATHGRPVVSWIADPSFGSATPSLNLAFFSDLTFGRLSSRKFLRSSVSCDSDTALICSSALAADVNGLNATSLHVLPNRSMLLTASWTFSVDAEISSKSLTSKTEKPDADSNSTKVVMVMSPAGTRWPWIAGAMVCRRRCCCRRVCWAPASTGPLPTAPPRPPACAAAPPARPETSAAPRALGASTPQPAPGSAPVSRR